MSVSTSKPPDRVCAATQPSAKRVLDALSPGDKVAEAWSHLVPKLRTTGAIPPLSHTPSWRAQGQLNFPVRQ